MAKKHKIRCAVIGLGMGHAHVKGFRTHPDAEVVAVCDSNPERLAARGDELGVEARFTDAKQMLRAIKPDVVSIATPNATHLPLTRLALEHGAHTLCEKPMAMTATQAKVMIATAKQSKRRLGINFSFRFAPASMALKTLVDGGILGTVYAARTHWLRRDGVPGLGGWFTTKRLSGGGPLIDLGVHRLDLALWYMGHPQPEWVLAGTHHHLAKKITKERGKPMDVEDMAQVMVRFTNGATLHLEASWASHIKAEHIETRVLGVDGGLVQEIGEGWTWRGSVHTTRNGIQQDIDLPKPPACHSSYASFIESIVTKRPPIGTGEEGLKVQQILDAAYKSAATGRPVKIQG